MIQKIFYGPPGTGKSHYIDEYLAKENIPLENIYRVTFHPEYTYNDFVGQIMPVIEKSGEDDQEIIRYSFIDGIFTQALKKAYLDLTQDVYLVIEEVSRANSAAVLGDIFQLLDRHYDGLSKGYSKYFITNKLIAKDILPLDNSQVKLPANFHILGTVNTSDQNVFVLDTAFKRRFDWEYIGTDPVKDSNDNYVNNPSIKLSSSDEDINIDWVEFYPKLNNFITSESTLGLSEDKQIGQFFIIFTKDFDIEEINTVIKNKLLFYLWEDVHKASFRPSVRLFKEGMDTFDILISNFDKKEQIFSEEFLELLRGD